METKSSLRERLEAAVMERHCANHPLTEKWAAGQISKNAMMGWGIEQYHWISNIYKGELYKAANTPLEAQHLLLSNYLEEVDPERPHLDIILRFAAANGADIEEVKKGRGLPTTEALVAWFNRVCKEESFIASVAATNIGTESQSPLLYGKVLPALRQTYRFKDEDIEHFWLHEEADKEHGGRGFGILDRYCTTPELQEMAVHYARESAKMRWFFFDGIYLHYEMGYKLR
jgi:pyrroloquinoline quinone (PQQ) biosynthesis protein C